MINQMIIDNLDIAHKITNDYIKKGNAFEYEDLRQICYLGLIKAVKTYEEGYHTAFTTYAYKVIQNEIYMNLRKWKKKENDVSIYTRTSERDGDETYLIDVFKDDTDIEDEIIDKDYKKLLKKAINTKLKGLEKDVLNLKVAGKKETEIAERLGISQSYANRVAKRAVNKLKDMFL